MLSFEAINADKWLSCFIAVDAAKSCVHFWNEEYLKDESLNKAIEAAEAWLSNPCEETANAAYAASAAAYAASASASANAAYAAYAAASASVANAANAANAAYAAYAAAYAAFALNLNKDDYIDSLLQKHLNFIIDYKIKHNQSFGDFEAVFEAASEADKEKLLFHLNLNSKE